jgi:hypothetical protein
MEQWQYDKRYNIHFCGTENDGIGVVQGDDQRWYATILVPVGEDFYIGPFKSVERAKKEAERVRANPSSANTITEF